MLRLPDHWVWDFWFADDGETYHLFFLCAPRDLPHPDDRHFNAAIGHAVSTDLRSWTRVADALHHGDDGAFDRTATWTGSVLRHPDGTWFLFYTGADNGPDGNVQRIGYATSPDLMTWTKSPDNPVLVADARWYQTIADDEWTDEAFRDPWVFPDADGDGWHMLITARARDGAPDERGIIGRAWSPDLRRWEARPPVTTPDLGFGQLEVTQVEQIDGRWVLLFSCLDRELAPSRRNGRTVGVWAAAADGPLGPFDIAGATTLTDSTLYSGRLIRERDTGAWVLLAFHHDHPDTGDFVGEISDPMPVRWDDGRLALVRD